MTNHQQNNGRNKKKKTPESKFYDTLKGHDVHIVLARDGSPLTATLLWVDRYTIGLRVQGMDQLINKRSIETIELLTSATRKRHESDCGAASQ